MLRELADEIETTESTGEFEVSCVVITKKFSREDLDTTHEIHGFGQFVTGAETISIIGKGLHELALMSEDEESDDGTLPETYQE